jgi:hypothetical protein
MAIAPESNADDRSACALSAYYARLLQGIIEGRRFVLAVGPPAVAASWASSLTSFGSMPSFAIVPTLPTEPQLREVRHIQSWAKACGNANDTPLGVWRWSRGLQSLPESALIALSQFDQGGSARVILNELLPNLVVAHRLRYGGDPSRWRLLENKLDSDALWSAAGVSHESGRVVAIKDLVHEHRVLKEAAGEVWSSERPGVYSFGGAMVRHVRDIRAAASAQRYFARHGCTHVKISRYYSGVPFGIHGFVSGQGIAIFRPVEQVVFRSEAPGFTHAGVSTHWDPPEGARLAIRDTARLVGAHLLRKHDYRGFFGIDGVLSNDGFLPTELNARLGEGGALLASTCPNLHLHLIDLALREREPWDFQPDQAETIITNAADRMRRSWAVLRVKDRGRALRTGVFSVDSSGTVEPCDDARPTTGVARVNASRCSFGYIVELRMTSNVPLDRPFGEFAACVFNRILNKEEHDQTRVRSCSDD